MKRLYRLLDAIGPSGLSVLILGETGTGKEVFAGEVHRRSPRAAKPFLQLNCAAISESLLESELFGHERGAFTGADRQKEGLFESADGGTVFLDEVGELTLTTQAKLLRFLESGEVMRLGSTRARKVDVRIVSATNRDLRGRIAEGAFRADLFFRINGMTVTLPPLRKRSADVRPLFEFFVARKANALGRAIPRLTDEAVTLLVGHAWPGNVRELRNVAERAVAMGVKGIIDREHIFLGDDGIQESESDAPTARSDEAARPHGAARMSGGPRPYGGPTSTTDAASSTREFEHVLNPETTLPGMRAAEIWGETSSLEHLVGDEASEQCDSLKAKLERVERQSILDALSRAGGNQTRAASMLGLTRFALMRRIEALGIARPRKEMR
jgi:transcriptional regulator with PAS, ATPase and Fis domain